MNPPEWPIAPKVWAADDWKFRQFACDHVTVVLYTRISNIWIWYVYIYIDMRM